MTVGRASSACSSVRSAVQADGAPAVIGQLLQRAAEIRHPGAGQALGRAGRGLGQGAGEGGRMAVLHDDAARAEGQGRAEDGADVLRVRQLIQHNDDAFSRFGQVFQIHAFQRLDLEGHALVYGPGGQHPAQGDRIDHLDSVAVRQILALNLLGAVFCDHQTAHSPTRRIRQSGQNRVASPKKIIGVRARPGGFALVFGGVAALRRGGLSPIWACFVPLVERLFFTGFPVVAFSK